MCFYVTAVRPVADDDDDDDERPRVVPADCGGLYESGNFRLRLGGVVFYRRWGRKTLERHHLRSAEDERLI